MKYILNYILIIIASMILAISLYQNNDINERAKNMKIRAINFLKMEYIMKRL